MLASVNMYGGLSVNLFLLACFESSDVSAIALHFVLFQLHRSKDSSRALAAGECKRIDKCFSPPLVPRQISCFISTLYHYAALGPVFFIVRLHQK
jgi:hypothetical protein